MSWHNPFLGWRGLGRHTAGHPLAECGHMLIWPALGRHRLGVVGQPHADRRSEGPYTVILAEVHALIGDVEHVVDVIVSEPGQDLLLEAWRHRGDELPRTASADLASEAADAGGGVAYLAGQEIAQADLARWHRAWAWGWAHCRHTRMGTTPRPAGRLPNALPITAPKPRCGSVAFRAWPRVSDVVSRSPILIGCSVASALHHTLPSSAIGTRSGRSGRRSRRSAGR